MEKVAGSSPAVPTTIMFTVYVLKSEKDRSYYVGFTSKDIVQRIKWHNEGSNRSTKWKGPYRLIHSEEFLDQSVALTREKFLKTGHGRRVLENILVGKG